MDTLFRMAEAREALAVVTIMDAYMKYVQPDQGEAFLAQLRAGRPGP